MKDSSGISFNAELFHVSVPSLTSEVEHLIGISQENSERVFTSEESPSCIRAGTHQNWAELGSGVSWGVGSRGLDDYEGFSMFFGFVISIWLFNCHLEFSLKRCMISPVVEKCEEPDGND